MSIFTDEDLAAMVAQGSSSAEAEIIDRYRLKAVCIAREFTVPGMPAEDKFCEAVLSLTKAAREYRPGLGMSFKSFAKRVVQQRMIELYRSVNTEGRIPSHLTLTLSPIDEDDQDLTEVIPDSLPGPLESLLGSERITSAIEALDEIDAGAMIYLINGRRDLVPKLTAAILAVSINALPKEDVFDLKRYLESGVQPGFFTIDEEILSRAHDELKRVRREIALDLLDGFSVADIAHKHGLTRDTVFAIFGIDSVSNERAA